MPIKKTPIKKTTRTKTTSKRAGKTASTQRNTGKEQVRALVCAQGEFCFWTNDGRVLEHLEDLELAFGSMDESVFLYHANRHKNDFSEWVESVLDDAALAAALRRCRKPHTASKRVRKHLQEHYKVTK